MTAPVPSFDQALDAILAHGGDPLVPDDLARRIVVRTAHLPQDRGSDAQAFGSRIERGSHFARRAGGTLAGPAAGAMAACIAMLLMMGGPDDAAERPAGGVTLARAPVPVPVPVLAPTDSLPTALPPARTFAIATSASQDPSPVRASVSLQTHAADEGQPAASATPPPATAPTAAPTDGGTFRLAAEDRSRVYGPVDEGAPRWSYAGPATGSPTGAGVSGGTGSGSGGASAGAPVGAGPSRGMPPGR